ncbi:helix-turn-helix transcriptional regulator [Populibacterium corticicola]|uniref:Helix-turn-helix transcriptional regulator n=1 Tax=Populibacterium corticicola TaxID=1812826 RepID=A0ABW5XCV1_9MICO
MTEPTPTARKKRTPETAATRTARLLALVGYLSHNGEATIDELAAHFNVTAKQIRADIDLLWVTGTPGYMADDLIDFDAFALDQGVVRLTAARGLEQPLRLGIKESIALLAALNALRGIITASDESDLGASSTTVERLISKLTLNLGENSRALDVQLSRDGAGSALAVLRGGIETSTPVRFTYVNASGETAERVVELWSIFNQSGHLYAQGFCRTADGPRVFRLDRMGSATLLTGDSYQHEKGHEPGQARVPRSGNTVVLTLHPHGRWLVDEVPHERLSEAPSGLVELTVDVSRPQWLVEFLLAHAGHVVSVSPPEYANLVADSAARALVQYGDLQESQGD